MVPTCTIYDPAYAYELAVIIQDGIRRMYQEMEDRFYYITVYNENYVQPPMPDRRRHCAKGFCAACTNIDPRKTVRPWRSYSAADRF